MKPLISMTLANLTMLLRARQALFWTLAFPLIILGLFGLIFGKGSGFSVDVGMVGSGPVAAAAQQSLTSIKGVTVHTSSQQTQLDALKKGDVAAVLVVPPGQPSAARPLPITLYYDQTNLTQGSAVVALVTQVVNGINQHLTGEPQVLRLCQEGIRAASNSYIDFLLPGVIAMSVMTSSVIGIAGVLVAYREQHILKRIRATPLASWQFLTALVISRMVMIVLQVLIMTTVAVGAFGVHISGNLGVTLGLAFLGGLAFLTIGFTLAGLAKTTDAASALANAVTMPMMFLSGVYFPVTAAPQWLKPIIGLLLLTYLANGLRDVMSHGAALTSVTTDIYFLLATVVVGFAVSTRTFRWE